jgi:hypothetical protein
MAGLELGAGDFIGVIASRNWNPGHGINYKFSNYWNKGTPKYLRKW